MRTLDDTYCIHTVRVRATVRRNSSKVQRDRVDHDLDQAASDTARVNLTTRMHGLSHSYQSVARKRLAATHAPLTDIQIWLSDEGGGGGGGGGAGGLASSA